MVLALCAAGLWPGALGQSPALVARAASVSGRVMLSSASIPSLTLTPGYPLNPGDRLDTRGGGRLVVDLSDGSVIIVQADTVLVIKDFRAALSIRELFEIAMGAVRVRINHFAGRPNPYRMNSPTASIAVRGTEFTVEVDPEGATQVVVFEGAVEVSSLADPGVTALVEAGRGVLVAPRQSLRMFPAPAAREGAVRTGAVTAANGRTAGRGAAPAMTSRRAETAGGRPCVPITGRSAVTAVRPWRMPSPVPNWRAATTQRCAMTRTRTRLMPP